MRSLAFLVLGLSALPLLSGCTPVGVAAGVGSSAGMAAVSEGGIPRALEDTRIRARINEAWFRADLEIFRKLNLQINQGRVLITGVVQKPEHRVEAVRQVWQIDGVKQVINEIKVANSEGIKGFVRDNWITTALKTKLLFDKDIQSVNYSVDTVQGVVYLMGVAQNQEELSYVTAHARQTEYVRNVVSYVRLLGQSVAAAPSSAQPSFQQSQMPIQSPPAGDPYAYDTPVQSTPLAPIGRPAPIVDSTF